MNKPNWLVVGCILVLMAISTTMMVALSRAATPTPLPTPTPWVKQDVLIQVHKDILMIWTNNAETDILKVTSIAGVIKADIQQNGYMIFVHIDPRYSETLIAKEIESKLYKED